MYGLMITVIGKCCRIEGSPWKEGTLDAIGTMQKITGRRHYDLLVCDDFVNIDDRLSPSLRVKKYLYLSEYVLNILTGKGLAINSGTFWHEEDANQELKKKYQDDENVVFEERVYPLGSVFRESKEEIASKKASLVKGVGEVALLRQLRAHGIPG